jgi:hypothetical protein
VAIDRASGGTTEDIIEALVLNAYADHFLEDVLAPGHMTESAADKSHMDNLRIHERDNRVGRDFLVNETFRTKSIAGLLAQGSEQAIDECFAEGESEVRGEIGELARTNAGYPIKVRLKGDGDLMDGDRVQPGSERQAALMVLLIARSVADVLEAANGALGNAFPNDRCAGGEEGRGNCYFVARGKNPFAGLAAGDYQYESVSTAGRIFPPVFGISAEMQRIKGTSRVQFSPELTFALPGLPKGLPLRLDDFRPELGIGYSAVTRAHDYGGHGPDLRVYFRNKAIYMFLAADLGYRFYSSRDEHANGLKVGGRIGFGNGLFWGFAGVSSDIMIDDTGSRRDSTTWGLGVAMTLAPEVLCRLCD